MAKNGRHVCGFTKHPAWWRFDSEYVFASRVYGYHVITIHRRRFGRIFEYFVFCEQFDLNVKMFKVNKKTFEFTKCFVF